MPLMNLYYKMGDGDQVIPVSREDHCVSRANDLDGLERVIGRTEIAEATVSTVFLSIDHGFDSDVPVLFETMVFGGPMDEYQCRYCVRSEAEVGHRKTVIAAKIAY